MPHQYSCWVQHIFPKSGFYWIFTSLSFMTFTKWMLQQLLLQEDLNFAFKYFKPLELFYLLNYSNLNMKTMLHGRMLGKDHPVYLRTILKSRVPSKMGSKLCPKKFVMDFHKGTSIDTYGYQRLLKNWIKSASFACPRRHMAHYGSHRQDTSLFSKIELLASIAH